jgi:hypothetical protein
MKMLIDFWLKVLSACFTVQVKGKLQGRTTVSLSDSDDIIPNASINVFQILLILQLGAYMMWHVHSQSICTTEIVVETC